MPEASGANGSSPFVLSGSDPNAASTRLGASQSLSSEERRVLEHTRLTARPVRKCEKVIREGRRTGSVDFLADGWACRCKVHRDGRRQISALIGPGDACNLDASFFDTPGYDVQMLTAGTIVSLPSDQARMLIDDHAGIARSFIWLGLVENARLAQWALCLGRQSARERVAHLLCELCVRLGCSVAEGEASFDLPLSQEQIGDAVGLTMVHVNRTLGQLRLDGLIAYELRRTTIRDIAALQRVANFADGYLHLDRERDHARGHGPEDWRSGW